jgi:hypothetical protein
LENEAGMKKRFWRRSLVYESVAPVLAFVGSVVLVWPLRDGFDPFVFSFGAGIIGVSWWFNKKAQRLKRDGKSYLPNES